MQNRNNVFMYAKEFVKTSLKYVYIRVVTLKVFIETETGVPEEGGT